ncbi:glutamate receptor-like [Portunus trituberculatus]|uniref:glutamate receptor-like n=1 Tax=Portunus trituberculatus TaxID=210409 RepID=UPI001E1CC9C4|nr:glutamate receptor-like [Portunus trituberculatus]
MRSPRWVVRAVAAAACVLGVWGAGLRSNVYPGNVSLDALGSESLLQVIKYLVERFLIGCDIMVLFDEGSGTAEAKAEALLKLGLPVVVVSLRGDGDSGPLEIPADSQFPGASDCPAYFIFADKAKSLRSLVESADFYSQLHYLGRFIFVTESAMGAPRLILDNPVMAWRPHALVITESGGVRRSSSYDVWSHEVFRDDVPERVHRVEKWRRGAAQLGAHLFPNKLGNFHGNVLRAVTFEHAPSIVEVEGHSAGHHYDGIDIRLLHILADALNFRLKIVNPSDGGKWGSPLDNGSWTGLTGDLTQRRAHMGVANLFIHIHYLEVVDMTVPYDMEFGCFITPLPEPLPQWVALSYPFSLQVWILTMVFLPVGTTLLYVASVAARFLLHDETWDGSFSRTVFYALGVFLSVGMPQVPRSNATRGYFIMWVWYGVLLTAVYRSSLTAFLTIPLTQTPIDTLHQLVSSSLPAWGATGLTFKKMLEENPDPMVQQLALRYEPVSGAEEGILLTAQRKYAMMENRQFLEYTIATNYTNKYGEETLHVMRECFLPFRIGMAMPKKAPYKPNLDRVVDRVVEAGLVRKWFSDILFSSRKRGTAGNEESRGGALTVDNLQGAWLLLGAGWVVSGAAIVLELLFASSRQQPRTGLHSATA